MYSECFILYLRILLNEHKSCTYFQRRHDIISLRQNLIFHSQTSWNMLNRLYSLSDIPIVDIQCDCVSRDQKIKNLHVGELHLHQNQITTGHSVGFIRIQYPYSILTCRCWCIHLGSCWKGYVYSFEGIWRDKLAVWIRILFCGRILHFTVQISWEYGVSNPIKFTKKGDWGFSKNHMQLVVPRFILYFAYVHFHYMSTYTLYRVVMNWIS